MTVGAEHIDHVEPQKALAIAAQRAGQRRALYFWHAWSALMVAPVLLLLLLSGSIYLFDREFDHAWRASAYAVVPTGRAAASLQQQQDFLRQQYPTATLRKVLLPREATQAVCWQLDMEAGSRLLYLDPYQLKVNAIEDPARAPMALVRRLHGELLAGTVGGYVIEWMSCWTLFLLLTGAWLWWPRQWRWGGVLWPRRRADGSRHWRDWHAISAMLASLMLAFLVLTGLPWSIFWGPQFANISHQLSQAAGLAWIAPSPNFHANVALLGSSSSDPATSHAQHSAASAPTAPTIVTDAPVTGAAEPWSTQFHQVPSVAKAQQGLADIQQISTALALLPLDRFGPGVRVFYPENAHAPFKISYVPDKAQGQRTIYVDAHSGKVLDDIGWQRYSFAAKVVEWGVMTHLGRQYGLVNQLLNLLFCLIAMAAILAGLRLCWLRRHAGRWLPQKSANDRLPRALQVSLLALALLLPLLWLSLALYWLIQLWQQRAKRRVSRA